MKDNNKKIFLGVIVVATLIITIVGATFAFFSASGGSANNAVTANATTLSNLGFTSSHSKIATNLVPVSSESPYFSRYPGIAASGEHSCLDDVGNEICSIYEFTVTNTASVAQTIYVSFVPSENTFDNMYFAAFNTSIASASYVVATGSNGSGNNFSLTPQTTSGNSTLGHAATKLTKNSTSPIELTGLSVSLGAGESVTYTILVWLQETGATQNTEQGGTFKAGVNVTTGGNATGVTGIMGETTNYVYTSLPEDSFLLIGQPIPDRMRIYTTAASAMAAEEWNLPFYLKHKMNNGVIEESFVEFVITPENVLNDSSLMAGTYTLRSGENAYLSNASIVQTAFGTSNCIDNSNPPYFQSIECNSIIGVLVYDTGSVSISGNGYYCDLESGRSVCDWSE